MTMDKIKKYSIGELAEITGINRRTVRFYIQRQLIPQPQGLGRGRHYTDEHLKRILKIKELQREGILLGQVSRVLKEQQSDLNFTFERELVTKIQLHTGVWLEFAHGVKIPSDETLEKVRKILQPNV